MIRDVIAAVIALVLLYLAMRMASTLTLYRRQRQRARDSERALGRTVIVEIPGEDDLVLFSEDAVRFYYGERSIDKDLIISARLMINGNPIAEAGTHREALAVVEDVPEGIARDRWDVAIEAVNGTTMVACGAIRERVSQELARGVFDAVKRSLASPTRVGRSKPAGPHHSDSGAPPR